jgi:hypothetical protein
MAILAAVIVARGRELPFVRVLMARRAGGEGHAIHGVFAFWRMTLRARRLRMFSEQRVSGLDVVRDREIGRLPTGYIVTGFAVASVGPVRKLPCVLVAVAIETPLERDMRFEILGLMTLLASHGRMFAKQRIVGLAMIEPVGGKNLFPSAGDVAAGAIAAKAAAVRVLVARRAVAEQGKVLVLDRIPRARR